MQPLPSFALVFKRAVGRLMHSATDYTVSVVFFAAMLTALFVPLRQMYITHMTSALADAEFVGGMELRELAAKALMAFLPTLTLFTILACIIMWLATVVYIVQYLGQIHSMLHAVHRVLKHIWIHMKWTIVLCIHSYLWVPLAGLFMVFFTVPRLLCVPVYHLRHGLTLEESLRQSKKVVKNMHLEIAVQLVTLVAFVVALQALVFLLIKNLPIHIGTVFALSVSTCTLLLTAVSVCMELAEHITSSSSQEPQEP